MKLITRENLDTIWGLLRKLAKNSRIGLKVVWFLTKEHRYTKKIIEELTKPKKPTWVLYILALVNFLALMLVGWKKFFAVFDDNARILIACEIAVFLVVLFLVYKGKENKTAMNWASFAVVVVVVLGLYFNHSGIKSWLKEMATETAEVKAVPVAKQTKEIKKEFNLSAGECVSYIFQLPGRDFSSRPQGIVRVKETTGSGEEYTYVDGPDVRIVLNKVEPEKIQYCSMGEPVKVVLREWGRDS